MLGGLQNLYACIFIFFLYLDLTFGSYTRNLLIKNYTSELKLLFSRKRCLFVAANTDWITVCWPSSSSFNLDVDVSLSPECRKIRAQYKAFFFI